MPRQLIVRPESHLSITFMPHRSPYSQTNGVTAMKSASVFDIGQSCLALPKQYTIQKTFADG